MPHDLETITAFLDRHGDAVGEIAWATALGWLDHAIARARESRHGRWTMNPDGELRRLRYEVGQAMRVARFAVGLQGYENERRRDLVRELQHELVDKIDRERRQAASREAARIGHVRRRARLQGREPTDEELYPALVKRSR